MDISPTGPPAWLLDVDGVVNATRPGWRVAPRRTTVCSLQDRCEYRPRWLHIDRVVELRWCTTCCPEAALLERLW
ncbi:hypothetical protein [Couchioplanes azureus]|uniref:hypothetical protein n=1 Tax=Couchioplanes caeruleus TaxID=56438 RepID=UPI00166FC1B6|nr:hypothetical protein [Couchioplanes caeruleus]GGQ83164.1 hypothetical protein GCM10010166_61780 [Couchioplanes caeruleus subsp. azureus]